MFVFLLIFGLFLPSEAARILSVLPAPSLSHQLFFRPIIEELLENGHEVTVITANPSYLPGETPANLTEIDVREISYKIYRSVFSKNLRGNNDVYLQFKTMLQALTEIFEAQFMTEQVQNLIKSQKFDLVITEAYYRIQVVYAHIFKVPAVLISSFGMSLTNGEATGSPVHPIYPSVMRQRVVNLTLWEYVRELYKEYWSHIEVYGHEDIEDALLKKLLPDAPTMWEVMNNVHLTMLNVFPPWEWNRPVPPGVVFLGPMVQKSETHLPQDLKSYLDNSHNGVIYISFGTAVIEALLPAQTIQIFNKVFSELPYNVIWKWGANHTHRTPKNVKFMKWVPQPELLKHPNVKLFITQGGIHSTYEAIQAAVPMIGIPMSIDQWFQTEHYSHKGIGIRLTFDGITEKVLRSTIQEVIENDSYRRHISRLRLIMNDQPQAPMQRLTRWIDHVLKHNGSHLRAPAANVPWGEILELELLFIVLTSMLIVLALIMFVVMMMTKKVKTFMGKKVV